MLSASILLRMYSTLFFTNVFLISYDFDSRWTFIYLEMIGLGLSSLMMRRFPKFTEFSLAAHAATDLSSKSSASVTIPIVRIGILSLRDLSSIISQSLPFSYQWGARITYLERGDYIIIYYIIDHQHFDLSLMDLEVYRKPLLSRCSFCSVLFITE